MGGPTASVVATERPAQRLPEKQSRGSAWASSSARTLARRLRRRWQLLEGPTRARALHLRAKSVREALSLHWRLSDLVGSYATTFAETVRAAELLHIDVAPFRVGMEHGNWARHAPPPDAKPGALPMPVGQSVTTELEVLSAMLPETHHPAPNVDDITFHSCNVSEAEDAPSYLGGIVSEAQEQHHFEELELDAAELDAYEVTYFYEGTLNEHTLEADRFYDCEDDLMDHSYFEQHQDDTGQGEKNLAAVGEEPDPCPRFHQPLGPSFGLADIRFADAVCRHEAFEALDEKSIFEGDIKHQDSEHDSEGSVDDDVDAELAVAMWKAACFRENMVADAVVMDDSTFSLVWLGRLHDAGVPSDLALHQLQMARAEALAADSHHLGLDDLD